MLLKQSSDHLHKAKLNVKGKMSKFCDTSLQRIQIFNKAQTQKIHDTHLR